MTTLDWLIMSVPLLLVVVIALATQRHLKSVADFMTGGRCAGRYLLSTARSELGAGAAVFVAMWEYTAKAGFTFQWWELVQFPVYLIVAITGFVFFRYRETRAMTIAQFFELRYSRRFRIFTGGLAFLAGVMNFGIIPSIGARFFVYFLGLPPVLHAAGAEIPTFIVLMGLFLGVTLLMTMAGGQITILVAACLEGMLSQIGYVIIALGLFAAFTWSDMRAVLLACPPGQSLVNPYDSFGIGDFNLWYVLMTMSVAVYGTMAWQGGHGFNSAALNAHESRMGNILGKWRDFARKITVTLLAICAVVFLRHPHFAAQSAGVHAVLEGIAQPQIRTQMEVPTAIAFLLPAGLKGLLCMIVLMGVISGDGIHLHSWGSILVQDVVVPLRKQQLSPAQHIRWLRWAVVGVAGFAFCFGALFRQTEYVVMWFQVTMGIYVGGAGAAIIGGLYWRKGTTQGAWAGLITGSLLSVAGIGARKVFPDFPLNGVQISVLATLLATAAYVGVSLLTCRQAHDMDRLLHRGRHAVAADAVARPGPGKVSRLGKLIGLDENFTRSDRWVAGGIFWWHVGWLGIFLLATVGNWFWPLPNAVWADYWYVAGIILPIGLAVVTTLWFTVGGVSDLVSFFRRLGAQRIDPLDDGHLAWDPERPSGGDLGPAAAAVAEEGRAAMRDPAEEKYHV